MKFTHYKTRTDEILLEEKMVKVTIASFEETAERYKNAEYLVFSPKRSKDFTEKPPKNKDGLTPSPQAGPVERRKLPR